MKSLHLVLVTIWLAVPSVAPAQPNELSLVVTDRETGDPVEGARATVFNSMGSRLKEGLTNERGEVTLTDLSPGAWTVTVARDGYATITLEDILAGKEPAPREIALTRAAPGRPASEASAPVYETIVVTASRTPETALDAPASTSTIDRQRIDEATIFTPVDQTKTTTGMDFATKGLTAHTFAVRGGRGVLSAALMTMTDYRYAGFAGVGVNLSYLYPLIGPDIERIELVRGPAAALYGLGSDRGVLHIVTRSPFDSPGTNLSVSGGERGVFEGWIRHSSVLSSKLAFKISGEYFQGDDWEYIDPVEAERRQALIDQGADPDTLRVGKRDFHNQRAMGEAQIEWRPNRETSVILTGGHAQAINNVEAISIWGGMQFRDFAQTHFQGRLNYRRLFVNLMHNRGNSGDSYLLRTGQDLVENSQIYAGQIQHGTDISTRYRLLYGADLRTVIPETGGTVNGRFEDNDTSTQLGAYIHGRAYLSPQLDLVAAVRGEFDDRATGVAISPRIGTVFHPQPDHAIRVTYNRLGSLGSPGFADLAVGQVCGLDLRVLGLQKDGFTFSRDCEGGLCMRSRYEPGALLPTDATRTWGDLAQDFPQLASIPAPDASQVGTDLKLLDSQQGFVPVAASDVQDIEMPESSTTTVIEGGYKGTIANRLSLGVDVYYTKIGKAFAEQRIGTPNVFYNEETLREYLIDQGMSVDEATQTAAQIAACPVGTISPEQAGASTDLLVVVEQTDDSYSFWGSDVSLEAAITDRISADATYSLLQDNVVIQDDVVVQILSVPENKASLGLSYRDGKDVFFARAQVRYTEGFEVQNGIYSGWIDSYTLLDIEASYRFKVLPSVRVFLNATNVFDHVHQEFIGVPEIGRLVVGRAQVDF